MPITQHRLFPVIVALWFAALFGLGSFAVAPEMLGRAVADSGLPTVLPAAAPPLGFTARALVALVLTGTGAIAGFLVGRGIARRGASAVGRRTVAPASVDAPKVRARDSHPDAPPRKPFTASEDMLPRSSEQPARRRALSVTDETGPMVAPEVAPLPGSREVEPLDLDVLFTDPEVAEIAPAPLVEAQQSVESPAKDPAPNEIEALEPLDLEGLEAVESEPAVEHAAPLASQAVGSAPAPRSPLAAAPLDSLGVVQLVERLALALSNYKERRPNGPLPQMLAAALAGDGPTAASVLPRIKPAPPVTATSAESVPQPVTALRPAMLAPLTQDHTAEAEAGMPHQAARFLRMEAPAVPAPTIEPGIPADAEDAIHVAEERAAAPEAYSSLLDIASVIRPAPPAPFAQPAPVDRPAPADEPAPRQVFVRIETPEEDAAEAEPVVVFPGQAPRSLARFDNPCETAATTPVLSATPAESTRPPEPAIDPEEADRALRAALATLQRMSGAR